MSPYSSHAGGNEVKFDPTNQLINRNVALVYQGFIVYSEDIHCKSAYCIMFLHHRSLVTWWVIIGDIHGGKQAWLVMISIKPSSMMTTMTTIVTQTHKKSFLSLGIFWHNKALSATCDVFRKLKHGSTIIGCWDIQWSVPGCACFSGYYNIEISYHANG